jgi:hypothetical protein
LLKVNSGSCSRYSNERFVEAVIFACRLQAVRRVRPIRTLSCRVSDLRKFPELTTGIYSLSLCSSRQTRVKKEAMTEPQHGIRYGRRSGQLRSYVIRIGRALCRRVDLATIVISITTVINLKYKQNLENGYSKVC